MRRAAKRDTVEASIVGALRKTGWSVEFLSIKDAPDLLLGLHGMTYLAEVKTGKAKLRPGQFIWHAQWGGSPVLVLRSVEDALSLREKLNSKGGIVMEEASGECDNRGATAAEIGPSTAAFITRGTSSHD